MIINRIYRTLERLFETATVDPFQRSESELNIPTTSTPEYPLQNCSFEVYSTQSQLEFLAFNL